MSAARSLILSHLGSSGRIGCEGLAIFLLQGAGYPLNVAQPNSLLYVTFIHPVLLQRHIVNGLLIANYVALRR